MSKIQSIAYNVIVQNFYSSDEVEVTGLCNGFTARNIGDTTAFINGVRLLPSLVAGQTGEVMQIGGNLGELYKGRIQLSFLGAGVAPNIEITQKFYINDPR